jgi:hypothetical protein
MRGVVKRPFSLALSLTFCAAPLCCATLQQLSLDDMIAKSTAIVRGRVSASYCAFSGSVIYTHYSVQVSEQLKGSLSSTTDVAVPGGTVNNLRQTFDGAPVFHSGEEYVFFLWSGSSGPTQVVGLTQGLFAITPGASPDDPTATRTRSAEVMLAPGTGLPVKDAPLSMRLSQLRSRISSALAAQGGSGAK